MGLRITLLETKPCEVYENNISHNLKQMAQESGLYYPLWRPEEIGAKKAGDLVDRLKYGLELLRSDPERFKKFDPEDPWSDYYTLVCFVDRYLAACLAHPEADIDISR